MTTTRKRKPKRHSVSKRAQSLLMGLSRGPIYARKIEPWHESPSKDPHDRLMHELEKAGHVAPIQDGDPSPYKLFKITATGQEIENENARVHAARVAKVIARHRAKKGY